MPDVAGLIRGFATFAAVALGGCAHHDVRVQTPLPAQAEYVAMGSSYAAGPGLGDPKPSTPPRCARDRGNYATLLSERMNLRLVDVTCSGATTAHILGPWDELPAQIDAVTPQTRLVTVTIGGNDVNFVGSLYAATCNPATSPRACPSPRIPTEAAWAGLDASLRGIVAGVGSRAPRARLVFVDYITIVPHQMCPDVPLSVRDAAAIRTIAARLAKLTAQVAREGNADVIKAGQLSKRHTPCDPDPWSVGMPGSGNGAPWHPNGQAMKAVASALERVLQSS